MPAYYKGDPDTVSGPDDVIEWPKYCEKFDFELELAVVIGRRGKNIGKADAKRYIAGYTIWNDWSARDQQMREGPLGMGPSKGKDFDTGNTIGPYLVTADELDVGNLRMTAKINGETWTDSTSAGRQFSFEDLIVHVSQSETIYPGELWGSGTTTGGSGLELDRWLRPGDVVEFEIEGIGVLRNRYTRGDQPDGTVRRAAEYKVQEGKEKEVIDILKKMIPLSRAEPGCKLYMVNQSPEDPRKLLLYEQYVDENGYKAHQATDAFKENILGKVVPMLESRVRNFYEVVEP